MAVLQNNKNLKNKYSKVSLSLENCILPAEKLSPSPSELDGLDPEAEVELRILACEMIQTSGILLRLPQVTMATGQVLLQRFFYTSSFVRHKMEAVTMACITLASKIEEEPRRIRDVANVFHHIKQVKSGKIFQPLLDQCYIPLKDQVIRAERRVLKELGFCVHVKHPHKIIVTLLEVLEIKNRKLMQTAWNYINDSLRTDVFVRYHPETIACACIYLSAKLLQIPLPNKPAWYLVFGVSEEDINNISRIILSLYTRRKPDPERLEKLVEELRKARSDARLKALNNVINSSPSQQGSPRNGTMSPGSDGKKERSDKHNNATPKCNKDTNPRKRRRISPEEGYQSKSSSSGSATSSSLSSRRKQKSPPRCFKESDRYRSRTRSKSRRNKRSKHRSSHKRRRSLSSGYISPHHTSKRSSKSRHSEKSRHTTSGSRSHERNHRSNSLHEKSRREGNHYSRDKKRR